MIDRKWFPCLTLFLSLAVAPSEPTFAVESQTGLLEGYLSAVARDHQIRGARAVKDSVVEGEAQAQSRLLPQVTLSSSRYRVWQSQNSNGIPIPKQSYLSESDSLAMRQAIYQPRLWAGLSQSRQISDAARSELEDQEQSLADRYLGLYLNVLLAREQLELTRRQMESVGVQLDATRKAFSAGTGIRTDIDETQAQFDRLVAAELQARQLLAQSKFELQSMIGAQFEGLRSLSLQRFESHALEPGNLDDWLMRLEKDSPRLSARRSRLKATEIAARAAKFEGYPTIDLILQSSRSSSDDAYNVNSTTRQQAVGVSLTIPVFTSGAVNSRARQTAADLVSAQEQFEQVHKQLELQVRQQFFAVREGMETISALEQAKRSADQALLANIQSFSAGVRRSLDVLSAEQRQLQAALDLSKARYQAILAWVRLHALVGAAQEPFMRQVNTWFE